MSLLSLMINLMHLTDPKLLNSSDESFPCIMASCLDHAQMCLQEGMNLNICLPRDILWNKVV